MRRHPHLRGNRTDGSALPAWLTFNASTRTFSGTPSSTGTLGVRVTATDLGSLAASETFNIAVTTTPNTPPTAVADAGDATEKGGIANGSGGSPASGNVLTNDTDPDAGDTKTVTAVSFGATTGTLGTALAGAYGSLVLNASGTFTYTVNENNAAVQALRQSTNTLTDVFSYTMRDTAGATSRRRSRSPFTAPTTRRCLRPRPATRTRPSARPSRWCCRPAPSPMSIAATLSPTRQLPPTARRFPPGWLQRRDADLQRHADADRHARRQGDGDRSRQPRRQRNLQYRRDAPTP